MHVQPGTFIDGQWASPDGREVVSVVNPATEEEIAAVAMATTADVDRAVASAAAVFPSWSATTPAERADLIARLAGALRAERAELASLITSEVGTPRQTSETIQVGLSVYEVAEMAALLGTYEFERPLRNSVIVREPIGVAAAITPWNFPLHQITAKLAPALAAGCTIVVKPSEVAPLAALRLAQITAEVGLPPGVVNVVLGDGPNVGEALAAHRGVDMVSFTGSTRAGRRVAAVGADTVKRVALELGGKSANVILDDADLEHAVSTGIRRAFVNGGQTCSALSRMLVPADRLAEAEAIAAEACERYTVGDPLDPATQLGPMASAEHRDRVVGYIRKGLAEGARLVAGGAEPPEGLERGFYVRPTVLSDVDPDSTVAQEEIFGPVLCILGYRDEDDAVAIANNSIYGLSGAVWSGDDARADRVARRLRTAQVEVNGGAFNAVAPFGGYKWSGNGREGGEFGLEEFLEVKAIQH